VFFVDFVAAVACKADYMVSNCVQNLLLSILILLGMTAGATAGTTFLIFPLENQTKSKALTWVSEGIAIAISSELQSPGVETISWDERARFIEASDLPANTQLSRASMIRVGQRASADRIVFGSLSGTEGELKIVLRVLNLRTMRTSGEKVANGPLSALPQIENDLAWEILCDAGVQGALNRESFRPRTRTVPNRIYTSFITCLSITDEEERVKALQKSLDTFKELPQASFLLGAHYFQGDDCTRAVPYLKPALKDPQSYLETQFMLGTCALKVDNPADAILAYGAFASRSESLEVRNNLGVAYVRKGDIPSAVQNLVEARKLAPSDLTVGLNLAILRHMEGDERAAMAVLENLVKTHPEQALVQYLYAVALTARGEPERAATAMDLAMREGTDPEKMKRQDPRTWMRIFPAWTRRPGNTFVGAAKQNELPYPH
jgi:Tfp pilus assembly protein PilF